MDRALEVPGWFGGLTLPEDQTKARRSIVVDKVGVKRDIVAEEFPFLKAHTRKAQAKYTFPAPSWHRVAWDRKHSRDAYPTARDFLLAMRDYIRDVVKKLIASGCTYIHMDAPNYAQWHTDPKIRSAFESWGHDMAAELVAEKLADSVRLARATEFLKRFPPERVNAMRKAFALPRSN